VASVSSFVSCKDYDDDINNLQKQIDNAALKSDLSALQTTLTSVQSTANSAATTAQQALTNAGANATDIAALKSTATQLGTDIAAAAKAAADAAAAAQAATDAADAATLASAAAVAAAAEEAKAAAEQANKDAQEKIDAAIADFTAKFDAVNAAAQTAATKDELEAVKKNAEALAKAAMDEAAAKATKADIDAAIAKLNLVTMDDVNKAIADAIAAAGAAQGTSQALGWEDAVTSVELIDSFTGNATQGINLNDAATPGALDMTILHGTVGTSSVFGDNEAIYNGNIWATATPQTTYTEGDDINFESGVIVRVNPVNADITDANILLVNSKGEALDDYVVIKKVERYNELITRGTTVNTGLWKVYFTMVEGKTIKDIKVAANDGVVINNAGTITNPGTPILYAVSINNTTDKADGERFVASSYDVAVDADDYVPAFTFGYTVNRKAVEDIANRWNGTMTVGEDGAYPAPLEYYWRNPSTAQPTPATAITYNGSGVAQNVNSAAGAQLIRDNRSAKKLLPVEIGVPFTVSGIIGYNRTDATGAYWAAATGYIAESAKIESYYVVLDEPRAVSSAPSEINAWKSYNYEGLGVVTPVGKSLNITITSPQANGDIIGFRVFAVNYDGTLADPDGRAFYVQAGNPADGGAMDVSYVATLAGDALATASAAGVAAATVDKSDYIEIPAEVRGKFNTTAVIANWADYGAENFASTDYPSEIATGQNIDIHWGLYQDTNGTAATSWADAKYVKVKADNPESQVDGSVLSFTIEGKDANDRVINTLTVNVTKTLPTEGGTVAWRTTMGPVNDVLTVYPSPSDATFAISAAGAQTITMGANVNPTAVVAGEYTIVWPTAAALNGAAVTSAIVDLGGYAIDLDAPTFDWEISGLLANEAATTTTTRATTTLPGVAYSSAALAGQGQYVVAINKKDMNTTKNSKIWATYPGVSLPSATGAAANVRFAAWEGKIKFASIFSDLFQYGNGSYSAWALNPVKTQAMKNDFYYFYAEEGKLYGKFDVNNFVFAYRAPATGVTEADVAVAASAITQSKYMDIIGTGYYANAAAFTGNTPTTTKSVKTFANSYTGAAWGTAYTASVATTAGGTSNPYNYFPAWNETTYPAANMITVDWVGDNADAKQTTRLKAQNAGLIPGATPLSSYITIGTGDCILTADAATVMTATINAAGDLILANRAGNVVTAKKADQKITLTSVTDQFGLKLTTQPSINFTLMPENSGMENGK